MISFLDLDANPPVRVLVGDGIELTTEDGSCVRTTVAGVELVHDYGKAGQFPLGIVVSLIPDSKQVLQGAKARVVR